MRHGGRVLEIPTVSRLREGGESETRVFVSFWTGLGSVVRRRFAGR